MYQKLMAATAGKSFPIAGRNTHHENIIIERNGNECFKITTAQANGWCRINYYYADGSSEELYER